MAARYSDERRLAGEALAAAVNANKRRKKQLNPAQHRELARELALGVMSTLQLSQQFGMSERGLNYFARRNAYEIAGIREALRANQDTELAGLWVAQRAARIEWYQKELERIGKLEDTWGVLDPEVVKLKLMIMKMIDNEIGVSPIKAIGSSVEPVKHVLEGVVVDELT